MDNRAAPPGAARSRARLRLAATAAVSIALHAALLAVAGRSDADFWRAGMPPAPVLQVRMLALPAEAAPKPRDPNASSALSDARAANVSPVLAQARTVPAQSERLVPAATAAPRRARLVPASVRPPASRNGEEDAPPPAPAAVPPTADSAGFVPRARLTRAPAPLVEIVPVVPADAGARGHQRGLFTLFIDERGRVLRMVADGPGLPPPFEAAARQAFEAARFSPGEIDGRPVRSLLRIEVSFDELSLRTGRPVPSPARAD